MTNDPTLDLARAALEIAAEDDALVSHSVVPLPVESYLSRLDVMAAEVANHHLPASAEERTPRAVFDALNKYLFIYQVRHPRASDFLLFVSAQLHVISITFLWKRPLESTYV